MSHKPALADWLLLFLLALIWGSSFILMKKGLEAFRPEQVACLRVLITAVVLFPFAIIRRKEIKREKLGYIFLQGLFGNFIPAFLYPAAQQHVDSSLAGILNSLTPVFVLLLGIAFFATAYNPLKIVGMAVAFSGSALLLIFKNSHGSAADNHYGWLIVAATVSYGMGTNIIKGKLSDVRPLTIAAVAFSMLAIPALIVFLSTDLSAIHSTGTQPYAALSYIAILAIFGTAVASIVYNSIIHRTTALFASSVTYLIPIVAVFWGFLAGENIGINDLLGMILILCGVYLVGK
jgi:drug/metabolite transporter (DMT)-like permease